ncbi:hypothetical protein COU78_05085 [Candidatus Peregrinibacteria bacterium CG10_big_fil_rev_8_21_14_0_10_49_24]|nr:MAG: hypothetical protein COV83_01455 [Candidatus Peregrinibacteria bacterium CG11_big_fil_rev_8_21_14_0_20_49_14]PIR50722.1 MAG: hypothetical protein COU78_05085 [Candidatus Peregrinibacteria bacterium CG10_big_fil_rev_8_21_14_0_10_49_24]PJA68234.1 MAG: hypothetical protein CO157_00725 [Candidatus Peregrinibacteria bacterium CG_4_9_14_3_um_filter_49_12]
MYTHIRTIASRQNLHVLTLSALAVVSSFALGVQSAGEVQPVSLIEAGSTQIAGDIDGSGEVTVRDAIAILEVAQGYQVATPQQLKADPNGDGLLTVDDAIRILRDLSL